MVTAISSQPGDPVNIKFDLDNDLSLEEQSIAEDLEIDSEQRWSILDTEELANTEIHHVNNNNFLLSVASSIKNLVSYLIVITVTIIGTTAVLISAPFVSLVVLPIYAIKTLQNWIEYRSLYKQTLTNSTREKFGRIPGQDYTRWDGKAIDQTNISKDEKNHKAIGLYLHGAPENIPGDNAKGKIRGRTVPIATDCSFKSQKDIEWLNKEKERLNKRFTLDDEKRFLRAFSKALIPIIGVIWVLCTEFTYGGSCQIGCGVCGRDEEDPGEQIFWYASEGLDFHIKNLRNRIN